MTKKIWVRVCTLLAIFANVAYTDNLSVTVQGIKAGQGNLRIAVFDEAHRDGFPAGEYLHGVEVAATEEQLTVEIPDVEPGQYAIAIIQDVNENKKLDKNVLGIPKEPYGFSGKWKSGKCSYEKALFNIDEDGFEVTIRLK